MATVYQRGLGDDEPDCSSTSSVAADARMMNIPEYILYDGTVFSMTHRDKKVVVPAFEEELWARGGVWEKASREAGKREHQCRFMGKKGF